MTSPLNNYDVINPSPMTSLPLDPNLLVDILLSAGEDSHAIDVMGENKMFQRLIDKAREVNKAETVFILFYFYLVFPFFIPFYSSPLI